METRVLIWSAPKPNVWKYGRTDARTDALTHRRPLESHLIRSPCEPSAQLSEKKKKKNFYASLIYLFDFSDQLWDDYLGLFYSERHKNIAIFIESQRTVNSGVGIFFIFYS